MSLSLDEVGSGWVRWVRLGELGFACEKLCKVLGVNMKNVFLSYVRRHKV